MRVSYALLAAVAGLGVGWWARRWLERGSWRLAGEGSHALPRWPWEPVAVGVLWSLFVHRLDAVDHLAAWPAVAVMVAVGVTLASIDLAVHRLPDVLTLGTWPVVAVLLAIASAVEGTWHGWVTLAWALGVGAPILLALGLAGLGLGDVKLGVLLLTTLGWFGTGVALMGLVAGFVLGGLWAVVLVLGRRADRRTQFAYGPWMLLGALLALAMVPA